MPATSKTIEKFLKHYAEAEAGEALFSLPGSRNWQQVIVVPARKEYEELLFLLQSLRKAAKAPTLLVLVVNNTETCSDETRYLNNEILKTLSLSLDQPHKLDRFPKFLYGEIDQLGLLLVNRSTTGLALPEKQGVGLARKIGADIALQLIHLGRVQRDWIFTTDADARLPEEYFQVSPSNKAVALTYAFRHCLKNPEILDYEDWLHRYVHGLRYAGSPYAHHTIGSTLALRAEPYAQVRGYPKKLAGEDFYILNKLAKLGCVETPDCQPILLSSRKSDRVPFGTGPALSGKREIRDYPDQAFEALKAWLELPESLEPQAIEAHIKKFEDQLSEFDARKSLNEIKERTSDREQFEKQFHIWFDGFKTLKFLNRS